MTHDVPVVFLDTNVVARYLGGGLPWLLDTAVTERFTYAINPVVLQELVLARRPGSSDGKVLEAFLEKTDMLQIDVASAEKLVGRAKQLGDAGVHANDLLILSSASDCDYLLTSDAALKALANGAKPKVMTPDAFHRDIGILE